MRLSRYGYVLVVGIVFSLILFAISVAGRYSKSQTDLAFEQQSRIESLKEGVQKMKSTPFDQRDRQAYINYQLALQLGKDGYVDKHSIDAALAAINYGAVNKDKVTEDFKELLKILKGNDQMATDIQNMVSTLTKFSDK